MKLAFLGILVTFIGGVSSAFGWAFQKKAYNQISGTKNSIFSKWLWWLGLLCIILTQPLYLAGIAMANQSTLGVVGPFALIANMALARVYLGESIGKWEYIGIILFIPGAILTLMYASMENNRYTNDEFNQLFFSSPSLLYLGFNVTLIVVSLAASVYIFKVHPTTKNEDGPDRGEYELGIDMDDITLKEEDFDLDETMPQININHRNVMKSKAKNEENKRLRIIRKPNSLYSVIFSNPRWRMLPLLMFPYTACFSTSLSMTFSRWLSGMAIAESESSSFGGVMPKIYFSMVVATSLFSYLMLNKSLMHFDTVYVVPLFKAGDLFHNILSGGIFLREFGEYTTKDFCIFMLGIIICITSISMLLLGSDKHDKIEKE